MLRALVQYKAPVENQRYEQVCDVTLEQAGKHTVPITNFFAIQQGPSLNVFRLMQANQMVPLNDYCNSSGQLQENVFWKQH